MKDRSSTTLYKTTALSTLYFFCLLCGYFILRPLRDEMGIQNGAINMQWLFTGTFVAMLCIIPLFGYLISRYSTAKVLVYSYTFFLVNILAFYLGFKFYGPSKGIAITFFIWLSVFNLFVVSLFWSFMSDIFNSASSKRFFGIIASGGSLGALSGPLIAHEVSAISIDLLLILAALFIAGGLCCILGLIALTDKKRFQTTPNDSQSITTNRLFEGIQFIYNSKYLLGIVLFVLLYTSISTVLYFEQAHIVEAEFTKSSNRIAYFSRIDFTVNAIAILGQFLLTAQFIKRLGLSIVLASIPFLMGLGLIVLGVRPSLGIVAALMILHRSGNFMLLRPGREILFTVTNQAEKYKAKNVIDTAIYRGGDALVGWLFATFTALGFGLGFIAWLAAPISFLWSITGYRLGKLQKSKEHIVTLKNKLYENPI
ncbi:NTP/NDP exchange transporter [Flagellimonas flava]|uniref:ATP:ADP antiporter, AAA family n=1 Tax=Flagellimonas flava TaxID=570519 RepID=A0A1M5IEB1_9FLAO|nr:MFS transporter [Allomuricauda flava]SHG26698.1 ATP:ADP antiporter, AAA family [Allomuricauda flava]